MSNKTMIGDYVTLQRGTTYKGMLVGKPGPALLGLGSIQPGGGFRESDYKTYGGDCPPKLMLTPGDLFVSLKGATKDGEMIGSVARVPVTVPSGRLTQDTVKLEFSDADKETVSYIYWILRTPQYRSYCAGHATGSAVVALSRSDFLSYPVPPLTEGNRQTVELLEAIEEKVTLNRQMNETLEEMARTLFRSWFVDFDPVHAKAAGRQPEGMDAETAALFPSEFVESELGIIPKGWEVKPIGECVQAVGGGTPKTAESEYWEGGTIHWATPKDLSNLSSPVLLGTERQITELGLKQISSGLLPAGTVLLSSRAPIGYLVISEVPVAVNQGFIAMVCNGPLPNHYVLHWAKANMETIEGRANGSTFMEISKSAFRPIPALVPSREVLDAFVQQVDPLYRQVVRNLQETQTLIETRESLLPKLISGKVRLPDGMIAEFEEGK